MATTEPLLRMAEPSPNRTLSGNVLDTLKQYIVSNELQAGDRIPTEEELARKLGASRVSVREATKALSLMGVVESRPRRGTVIKEFQLDRLSDLIGFHFATSTYTVNELVQARLIVEVGHLEFAIGAMDEQAHQRLLELARMTELDTASRKEWVEADMAFHEALLELGGNRPIKSLAMMLRKFFDLSTRRKGGNRRKTAEAHVLIVEALHERNLPLAQGLMRQHVTEYIHKAATDTETDGD